MDYKEKYEQALERAQGFYNAFVLGQSYLAKDIRTSYEKIFPELKETEDEKVKERLMQYIWDLYHKDFSPPKPSIEICNKWLAWLEKQMSVEEIVAKYKNSWYNEGKIAGMSEGLTDDEKYQQGWHDALEKQGEQKPINMPDINPDDLVLDLTKRGVSLTSDQAAIYRMGVEDTIKKLKGEQKSIIQPKFKPGDWITNGAYVIQITSVDDAFYWHENDGICGDIESVDKEYHLWSIEDAKDGDILAEEPISDYTSPFIAIYKERGLDFFNSYCFIGFDGIFYKGEDGHVLTVHPATKEQRDLLFSKMKEYGYEWDSKNKKLLCYTINIK